MPPLAYLEKTHLAFVMHAFMTAKLDNRNVLPLGPPWVILKSWGRIQHEEVDPPYPTQWSPEVLGCNSQHWIVIPIRCLFGIFNMDYNCLIPDSF